MPLHFGGAGRFETAFFIIGPFPFTVGAAPEVVLHAVGAVPTVAVFTPMLRHSVTAAAVAGPLIPVVEVGGPGWSVELTGMGIHGG